MKYPQVVTNRLGLRQKWKLPAPKHIMCCEWQAKYFQACASWLWSREHNGQASMLKSTRKKENRQNGRAEQPHFWCKPAHFSVRWLGSCQVTGQNKRRVPSLMFDIHYHCCYGELVWWNHIIINNLWLNTPSCSGLGVCFNASWICRATC